MSFAFRIRGLVSKSFISLRASVRCPKNIEFGREIRVESGCIIQGPESDIGLLEIGNVCVFRNRCYVSSRMGKIKINNFCYFGHGGWIGGRGCIEIGNNSIFGPNVVIISSNHDINCNSIPRFAFPEISGKISIGDNVWVGANVVILPGSEIGDNSVIGAGSVVSGKIESDSLAFGNPASVRRSLDAR